MKSSEPAWNNSLASTIDVLCRDTFCRSALENDQKDLGDYDYEKPVCRHRILCGAKEKL
jgi:hypothetical protein